MDYTVEKLAKLAGITSRTVRYYDKIGLLKPKEILQNGYRVYGEKEVDILQQILFFRELAFPLSEIKKLITATDFDEQAALCEHLSVLLSKRKQIDILIENVEKTIKTKKGELQMTNEEKFEGLNFDEFKKKLIKENEDSYGEEIRQKYGKERVEKSNKKLQNMSKEQFEEQENLTKELASTLKSAVKSGEKCGDEAKKLCELHKKWLCFYWTDYSAEAHLNLAKMYVEDERFKAYYEEIVEGGAEFLYEALSNYLK